MNRTLSLVVMMTLSLVVSPVTAAETASRWPWLVERGRYQTKILSTGQVVWSVQWETRVTEKEGQPRVEIREQGQGQPFRYPEPIRWEKTMIFSAPAGAPIRVERVEGQRWKQTGEPISSMEVKSDPVLRQIRYRDQEGKKKESTVFPWTPLALPDELLFHWARTLPYEKAAAGETATAECLLLVSPKRRFFMDIRIRGVEQITVPAGTFSCYRVDFTPRLAGPLKALAPKMAFWCRADFPHSWVRYEGPVGGPGSPQAVIELVEFKTEGAQP